MTNAKNEKFKNLCNFLELNGFKCETEKYGVSVRLFLWAKIKMISNGGGFRLVSNEWREGLLFALLLGWALTVRNDSFFFVAISMVSSLNLIVFLMKIKFSIIYSHFKQ